MQPEKIKALRKRQGGYWGPDYEAQETFARILGVSRRTYQNIESGESKPKPMQLAILQELQALQKAGELKTRLDKLKRALEQYPFTEPGGYGEKRTKLPAKTRHANEIAGIRATLAILFEKPA